MVMQWWRERAPREQALLGGGAVVLLLTVAYLMIEPVLEERRRLAAEIPQLRQDLAWMQEHLAEVQRLRRAGTATPRSEGAPRLTPARVEGALRQAGLGEQVAGLRPAGDGGVRVTFEQVAFPELAQWLHRLHQDSGATVTKARVRRLSGEAGMVEAQLTLNSGANS
ncbi:MAG TPA: type II secretion system protein M [Gammaproteobacteria bacterium]|nr:type II secretion system protein M [Gammaproteobacteria bacterium]